MKFDPRFAAVAVMTLLGLVGCQNGEAPVSKVQISETLNAKLAAADVADGEEDHRILDCYSCNLAMRGKEDISTTVNGYTAIFCSEECRDSFEKDAEQVVTDVTP